MARRYYTGRDPGRAQGIADLRAMARRRLPAFAFEYLDGGAEDEATLAANRAAFAALPLLPRMLRDLSAVDPATTILGRPAALPVIIAPTGFAGLFWREGDIALARAAAQAGVPMCQSIMSNSALGQVAAAGGRHWMQIYPLGLAVWEAILDEAAAAGTEAIVLTVDGTVLGNREWDRRHYARPFALRAASLAEMLRHPGWVAAIAGRGLPGFPNIDRFVPTRPGTAATARWATTSLDTALDWGAVRWLRDRWPGALVVKGLLHPDDALRALDAGADALVVSNHGGRQLDGAPAALDALPAVAAAVGGRAALWLDSGIRRGADIARALALGAQAVLVGRATLYGLAAAGAAGVARALAILRDELVRVLRLLGVTRPQALDDTIFFRPGAGAGHPFPEALA
jgi:(S)-mandelate dehydrogenase